jgi:hypothetical protein
MLGGLDYHSITTHVKRLLLGNALAVPLVQVLDSVAALKALPVPAGAVTYLVRGFAAAGDGGGGFYWWDATSATADDGGTIIQLSTGGAGRFKRLFV